MNVVLFLDFDGVLHPEPGHLDGYLCHIDRVQDVLREFKNDIEIVISSSWRDFHSLDELRDMFAPDIGALVVGVTPSIKTPSPDWLPGSELRYEREWEIETWLKANRPWGTPWLAIDDRAQWFREDSANLLLTVSSHGFALEQQATLRNMIQERLELL
jgi:hypothetical protein